MIGQAGNEEQKSELGGSDLPQPTPPNRPFLKSDR